MTQRPDGTEFGPRFAAFAPVVVLATAGWTGTARGALISFLIIFAPLTISALFISWQSKKERGGFWSMFAVGLLMSFLAVLLEIMMISLASRDRFDEFTEYAGQRTPYVLLGMILICGILWQIYIGFDSGYRESEERRKRMEKAKEAAKEAAERDENPNADMAIGKEDEEKKEGETSDE